MISLQEKSLFDYKKIYQFDDYVIYQIDLDYCRKKISSKNHKDLWITEEKEKLNDCTKEWLKYLTLSTWCKSFTDNYFALPPIKKEFFSNNYVYEAITILCNQDNVFYQMELYDQEIKEKKIKEFIEKEEENKKLKEKIKQLEKQLNQKKKKSRKVRKTYPRSKSNSSED